MEHLFVSFSCTFKELQDGPIYEAIRSTVLFDRSSPVTLDDYDDLERAVIAYCLENIGTAASIEIINWKVLRDE